MILLVLTILLSCNGSLIAIFCISWLNMHMVDHGGRLHPLWHCWLDALVIRLYSTAKVILVLRAGNIIGADVPISIVNLLSNGAILTRDNLFRHHFVLADRRLSELCTFDTLIGSIFDALPETISNGY